MIQNILIALSAALTLACGIPYILDIIRGNTKPRIVSWFTWSLLTGIATAAAITEGHWPSAVLTAAATLETATIVILGLKYGDRKIERFDVLCQIGAIIGLILWLIFNDPLVALLASVSIDFIAGLPTYRHAWKKPKEETRITFVLASLGALCSLLAISEFSISGIIFPAYLFVVNLVVVIELGISPHRHER